MAIVQSDQLPGFAQEILSRITLKSGRAFLIFLSGDLGSGKTTFLQAFAKELNITETVQSPTFVLMKKYATTWNGFKNLIHIDAYRLEDPKEFAALKPEEFLNDPQNLICIEWADNIASVLPKPDLILSFSSEGMREEERNIEIIDK